MTQAFPAELQELVRQELATGKYASESDVLLEAMKLLRKREFHLKRFRENLKARLDRLDRGDGIDLDDASLEKLFEEIEREANAELISESR
jgi:Arc/MetJ-type ribon-helix-helix transcriptional regulator